MAKTARRKRKPAATSRKRRGFADLLDIKPPRTAKPPTPAQLRERKKMLEEVAQAWARGMQGICGIREIVPALELPDDWAHARHQPEPKNRPQPQQKLCRQVFPKLFPDGPIPDEAELSTTSLRQMIAVELEREAKRTGKKPRRTPSWDVVRVARRNP
jgi:hypothetical protein